MCKIIKLSLVLLASGTLLTSCSGRPAQIQPEELAHRQLITMQIGERELYVEVVDQPKNIELGLGNRDEIGSDGMLFVFPQKRFVSFWMYQMRFPLDIVWIDDDQVIGLSTNLPPPEPAQSIQELPTYRSPAAVTHVLEIDAGRAEELGLTVGDLVMIDRPI